MTKQADEERTGFDDWLPVRAEYIAPGEYKIVTCGGLPLWYMEGAALAEWICERINAIPDPGAVLGQVKAMQEAINSVLRILRDDHIRQNKHRLGVLGSQDIETAIRLLKEFEVQQ